MTCWLYMIHMLYYRRSASIISRKTAPINTSVRNSEEILTRFQSIGAQISTRCQGVVQLDVDVRGPTFVLQVRSARQKPALHVCSSPLHIILRLHCSDLLKSDRSSYSRSNTLVAAITATITAHAALTARRSAAAASPAQSHGPPPCLSSRLRHHAGAPTQARDLIPRPQRMVLLQIYLAATNLC